MAVVTNRVVDMAIRAVASRNMEVASNNTVEASSNMAASSNTEVEIFHREATTAGVEDSAEAMTLAA